MKTSRAISVCQTPHDDLSREVYCIMGLPIDAVGMPNVLEGIHAAASLGLPFLFSTANLNFLVISQTDPMFRETLLTSNLCTADGAPIVCIAHIIGIPIRNRVAGSDIFDALKTEQRGNKPLKVFLFGGAEGVAAGAARVLGAEGGGLDCVGAINPGMGSVEELSSDNLIQSINASGADMLIASLGARKGQLWLLRNHDRLSIPVRAHLGAAVSFQAGTVKRAPRRMRNCGLEWLWRIKEEPYLWRRYWSDGAALLRLILTRVVPLAILTRIQQSVYALNEPKFSVMQVADNGVVTLRICGAATAQNIDSAIASFRTAAERREPIVLDLSEARAVDARFLGLLLMLRKRLKEHGLIVTLTGASSRLKFVFRLSGVDFLFCNGNNA